MRKRVNPRLDDAFFQSIPDTPGVYFMLDRKGTLLYIGKAKHLRRRLKSYRRARAGTHPPNVVEMVRRVHEIRWENCRTEREALIRENELLHAIRPPYNIADTEPESYFFVVVRKLRKEGFVEFQITSQPNEADPECILFGCYKNRIQTKRGYMALMRLIYSATCEGPRFSIPSRIGSSRLAYSYCVRFPDEWMEHLSMFLRGESLGFLRHLTERLIENENVPRFMGPSLQEDIDRARAFFRSGPKATRALKRMSRVRARILSHDQMDDLIRRTLSIESSEQSLKLAKR